MEPLVDAARGVVRVSPLWCPVLFAPFGVSLVPHTLTLLPALAVVPLARAGSIVAAMNAVILVHLFLNLLTAYALAYRITRSRGSSILAAVVFGWSPYIGAHLLGHLNLVAAWVLPLDALLTLKALEDEGRAWPAVLGLALAATAYTDYYYAVYAGILLLTIAGSTLVSVSRRARGPSRLQRATLAVLGGLFAAAIVTALAIALTGGTTLHLGSAVLSMRSAGNALAAATLTCCTAVIVCVVSGLRIQIDAIDWWIVGSIDRTTAPPDLVAYVSRLPLRRLAADGTRELWIVEQP